MPKPIKRRTRHYLSYDYGLDWDQENSQYNNIQRHEHRENAAEGWAQQERIDQLEEANQRAFAAQRTQSLGQDQLYQNWDPSPSEEYGSPVSRVRYMEDLLDRGANFGRWGPGAPFRNRNMPWSGEGLAPGEVPFEEGWGREGASRQWSPAQRVAHAPASYVGDVPVAGIPSLGLEPVSKGGGLVTDPRYKGANYPLPATLSSSPYMAAARASGMTPSQYMSTLTFGMKAGRTRQEVHEFLQPLGRLGVQGDPSLSSPYLHGLHLLQGQYGPNYMQYKNMPGSTMSWAQWSNLPEHERQRQLTRQAVSERQQDQYGNVTDLSDTEYVGKGGKNVYDVSHLGATGLASAPGGFKHTFTDSVAKVGKRLGSIMGKHQIVEWENRPSVLAPWREGPLAASRDPGTLMRGMFFLSGNPLGPGASAISRDFGRSLHGRVVRDIWDPSLQNVATAGQEWGVGEQTEPARGYLGPRSKWMGHKLLDVAPVRRITDGVTEEGTRFVYQRYQEGPSSVVGSKKGTKAQNIQYDMSRFTDQAGNPLGLEWAGEMKDVQLGLQQLYTGEWLAGDTRRRNQLARQIGFKSAEQMQGLTYADISERVMGSFQQGRVLNKYVQEYYNERPMHLNAIANVQERTVGNDVYPSAVTNVRQMSDDEWRQFTSGKGAERREDFRMVQTRGVGLTGMLHQQQGTSEYGAGNARISFEDVQLLRKHNRPLADKWDIESQENPVPAAYGTAIRAAMASTTAHQRGFGELDFRSKEVRNYLQSSTSAAQDKLLKDFNVEELTDVPAGAVTRAMVKSLAQNSKNKAGPDTPVNSQFIEWSTEGADLSRETMPFNLKGKDAEGNYLLSEGLQRLITHGWNSKTSRYGSEGQAIAGAAQGLAKAGATVNQVTQALLDSPLTGATPGKWAETRKPFGTPGPEQIRTSRGPGQSGDISKIDWLIGRARVVTQPMKDAGYFSSEVDEVGIDKSAYAASVATLAREGSTGSPSLAAIAGMHLQNRIIGESEKGSTYASSTYPREGKGLVGGYSDVLADDEMYVPGWEGGQLIKGTGFPTGDPETTWGEDVQFKTTGRERIEAAGLSTERMYWGKNALQAFGRDVDGDILYGFVKGLFRHDPATGKIFDNNGEELGPGTAKLVGRKAQEAASKGHANLSPEFQFGMDVKGGRGTIKGMLANVKEMAFPQAAEAMRERVHMTDLIGKQYNLMKRRGYALSEGNVEGQEAIMSLHEYSHSRAQRPERLHKPVERLHEARTWSLKGGVYNMPEKRPRWAGLQEGAGGLMEFVNKQLMSMVNTPVGEAPNISARAAAVMMAPSGNEAAISGLTEAYTGARVSGGQETGSNQVMNWMRENMGAGGEAAELQWMRESPLGMVYGSYFHKRIEDEVAARNQAGIKTSVQDFAQSQYQIDPMTFAAMGQNRQVGEAYEGILRKRSTIESQLSNAKTLMDVGATQLVPQHLQEAVSLNMAASERRSIPTPRAAGGGQQPPAGPPSGPPVVDPNSMPAPQDPSDWGAIIGKAVQDGFKPIIEQMRTGLTYTAEHIHKGVARQATELDAARIQSLGPLVQEGLDSGLWQGLAANQGQYSEKEQTELSRFRSTFKLMAGWDQLQEKSPWQLRDKNDPTRPYVSTVMSNMDDMRAIDSALQVREAYQKQGEGFNVAGFEDKGTLNLQQRISRHVYGRNQARFGYAHMGSKQGQLLLQGLREAGIPDSGITSLSQVAQAAAVVEEQGWEGLSYSSKQLDTLARQTATVGQFEGVGSTKGHKQWVEELQAHTVQTRKTEAAKTARQDAVTVEAYALAQKGVTVGWTEDDYNVMKDHIKELEGGTAEIKKFRGAATKLTDAYEEQAKEFSKTTNEALKTGEWRDTIRDLRMAGLKGQQWTPEQARDAAVLQGAMGYGREPGMPVAPGQGSLEAAIRTQRRLGAEAEIKAGPGGGGYFGGIAARMQEGASGGIGSWGGKAFRNVFSGWELMRMQRMWSMTGATVFNEMMPMAAQADHAAYQAAYSIGGGTPGLPMGAAGQAMTAQAAKSQAKIEAGRTAYDAWGWSQRPGPLNDAQAWLGPAIGHGIIAGAAAAMIPPLAPAAPLIGVGVGLTSAAISGASMLYQGSQPTPANQLSAYQSIQDELGRESNIFKKGEETFREKYLREGKDPWEETKNWMPWVNEERAEQGKELAESEFGDLALGQQGAVVSYMAQQLRKKEGSVWSGMDETQISQIFGQAAPYEDFSEYTAEQLIEMGGTQLMQTVAGSGLAMGGAQNVASAYRMGGDFTKQVYNQQVTLGAKAGGTFLSALEQNAPFVSAGMDPNEVYGMVAGGLQRQPSESDAQYQMRKFRMQERGQQLPEGRDPLRGRAGVAWEQGVGAWSQWQQAYGIQPGSEESIAQLQDIYGMAAEGDMAGIGAIGRGAMYGAGAFAATGNQVLPGRFKEMALAGRTGGQMSAYGQSMQGRGVLASLRGMSGMNQRDVYMGLAAREGRVQATDLQMYGEIGGFAMGEMGYSMAAGGWGAGEQLNKWRQNNDMPLVQGAAPLFVEGSLGPGGGTGIFGFQDQERMAHNRYMMQQGQQYQMGTGQWATSGGFQMGMLGQLARGQDALGHFQQVRGLREDMFELNLRGQNAGIDRAMESATLQYQQGQERLDLSRRMWQENKDYQRQEMGISWGQMQTKQDWSREDFAYGREMAGLQYGWQQEDLDRNIRFASGREKQSLMRQRDRGEEMYSRQESRRGTEEERAETQMDWDEQRFGRQKAHFEAITALELEQFEMQERHMQESYAMQMKHLKEQKGHLNDVATKQRELQTIQDDQQEEDLEYRNAVMENQIKYYEEVVFPGQEKELEMTEEAIRRAAVYRKQQIDDMSEGGKLWTAWGKMIDFIETNIISIINEYGGHGGSSGGDVNTYDEYLTDPVTGVVTQNPNYVPPAEGPEDPFPENDPPQAAMGSRVMRGESRIVGEFGPEPFVAPVDGFILPNPVMNTQAGEGDTYHIQIDVSGVENSGEAVALMEQRLEKKLDEIAEKQRRRGRSW